MEGIRSVSLVFLGLALAGCGARPDPPYPDWSTRELPATPSASSSNAFDYYARAALDAEAKGGTYLNRLYFPPDHRAKAAKRMAGGLALLRQGAHNRCEFRFTPTPPFQNPPYQRGWRLLARVLVWQIEDGVANENYAAAIKAAIVATKFGFDLCGGGATDASLGLAIVDEARRALTPALDKFQNAQLAALARGVENALTAKPAPAVTIENEERNMMAAVQFVQDAYRTARYDELEDNLGTDIGNALDHLKEMRRHDAEERPAYFQGFAAEAEQEAAWAAEQAKTFAGDRRKPPDYKGKSRPWWRFSRHFFQTLRPLLAVNDVTVARTRLLVLTASIRRTVRTGRPAPKTLGGFKTALTTDPFSGRSFIYRAEGPDYEVYSVGADFRDDGGQTDEHGVKPDLKLEDELR